jgi:hypothetical protein
VPPGRTRLRLRVAGRTLVLRARQPLPALAAPPGHGAFVGGRGADIVLDVSCGPAPVPATAERLFDSGGTWEAYRDGPRHLLYTFRTAGPSMAPERVLRVDRRVRRGTLVITDERRAREVGFALGYPLDDVLFQHHLAHRGELVLHGAGLLLDGAVVVLAGASGAGKTTSVRLWRRHHPRARVLSDDRLVVRRRGRRWWTFGTPWHGEGRFQAPDGAPLAAIVLLRQDSATFLGPVSPADACLRLCGLTFPPRWDRTAMQRVLDAVARLSGDVPVWELHFRPDRSAVDVVRAALRG